MIDGVRILRHLGFTQIPSITKNVNFRIIVDEADNISFIQDYRKTLQETKKEATTRNRRKENVQTY
jgi:hypothetical protein